jgi:hypothetical protein
MKIVLHNKFDLEATGGDNEIKISLLPLTYLSVT